ncbi:DNA internalization-related competence protein ComEC/Rec2 [Microbulbifer sp. SA54]|uniref:DNA internalization-related competence protein ComEC/Rec2 n=1 Tax=Microbulbifer sp. SA54 TaxID=3401577 RepID=UPI003AAAB8F9
MAFWPALPHISAVGWLGYFLVVLLVAVLAFGSQFPRFGGDLAGARVQRPARKGSGTLVRIGCRLLLPVLIGTAWALYVDRQALDQRLPEAMHGADVDVTVRVTSLPEVTPATSAFGHPAKSDSHLYDVKFTAQIESVADSGMHGQAVVLGWYGIEHASVPQAGSRWQLQARLKRPRGTVNPHAFDYEAWLLEQGVYATGYVRDKSRRPLKLEDGAGMPALRERLRSRIDQGSWPYGRLIRALLLGDRSGLTAHDEQLLRTTGTGHLLAISGLHVGMVAGFFLLLGAGVSRITGLVIPHNPRVVIGLCGILGALCYTLLCGAPLSAQRAWLMTSVALVAWICRRRISAGLAVAVALALVLVWQPLAVLGVGFWLSFGAVAALLLRFSGRQQVEGAYSVRGGADAHTPSPRLWKAMSSYLSTAWRSQWAIALALLIPSILFFSGASVSALIINLVAIPWVGFLILPPILLGTLCPADALTELCWSFASWQLGQLLAFLDWGNGFLAGWHGLPAPGITVVILGLVSVVMLLMPRGFPGRRMGWCLIPVVLAWELPGQPAPAPALSVTVLDVGQGLAVVVDTGDHQLAVDAGADTNRGWSAGRAIVAPFLIGNGHRALDALVVSHGDRDHAGGVAGLAQSVQVRALIAPGALGQRLAGGSSVLGSTSQCVAGKVERWGGLTLEWLWPDPVGAPGPISGEENDHSCVGLLRWGETRILLTGDISRQVERELAQRFPEFAPVDLLVAPHHGSRTSSSQALIEWARPEFVAFSTGYRHHFGHPHPQVTRRYRSAGVKMFNTASLGAIRFSWREGQSMPDIDCARESLRFWFAEERAGVSASCAAGT